MATPVVANVFDESGGDPSKADRSEIVFTTFAGSAYNNPGVLRVISGFPDPNGPPLTHHAIEYWNSLNMQKADQSLPESDRKPFYSSPSSTPALGDIDGDGKPDVVTLAWEVDASTTNWDRSVRSLEKSKLNVLVAVKGDGTKRLWTAPFGDEYPLSAHSGTAVGDSYTGLQLADLDADGHPEVIVQNQVYNYLGERKCILDEGNGKLKYPQVLVVADLDNDGRLELVTSHAIFKYKPDHTCERVFLTTDSHVNPFIMAIADLDKDGSPELIGNNYQTGITIEKIVINGGKLERKFVRSIPIPVNKKRAKAERNVDCDASPSNTLCIGGGGQPIIADFDGDGSPEIGIAGRWYYFVFESDGSVLWAANTHDFSSATTSSSVFDFDGDGKAEVVYNDEQSLFVYDGAGAGTDADNDGYNDAKVIYSIKNLSGTLREYPVIADLNHDGHANIIVAANDYGRGNDYHGIRVFAEPDNQWVPTRQIWNQFNYFVTNVEDNGTIPSPQAQNWKQPWLNNYLQNIQKGNPFLLPNVKPVIQSVGNNSCNPASFKKDIIFNIKNVGARTALKGTVPYKVTVTDGTHTNDIATGFNKTDIPPNGSETITIPDTELGTGMTAGQDLSLTVLLNEDKSLKECKSNDNTATVSGIRQKAPNLVVEKASGSCYGGTALDISYTIANLGAVNVPPNNVIVKIYAGLENNLKLVETYTYDQPLDQAASFEGSYRWTIPAPLQGLDLKVRVVVDEDNTVVECKEADNERSIDPGVCVLYG